jgi:toxin YoeB
MRVSFTEKGWDDYASMQRDIHTIRQIQKLITDIQRNGYQGIGKPEQLSGNWSGWWSRRIDQ